MFRAENRVVLTYVPGAGGDTGDERRGGGMTATASSIADRPDPGEPRPYQFPFDRAHRALERPRLIAVHLPGRALVSASLVLPAGAVDEPAEQAA